MLWAVGDCRFAKEHEGQYDWVRKNEGHKGVQVTLLSGFGDYVVQTTLLLGFRG
jgi:hypothetical protein